MTIDKFKHYFICECGTQRWLMTGSRLRCHCGITWFMNSNHVRMKESAVVMTGDNWEAVEHYAMNGPTMG